MDWRKSNDGVLGLKKKAESHLQEFGRRIGQNVREGQEAFKNRKNNKDYYKTTNIFKGVFDKK